jgi:hypothetical protein
MSYADLDNPELAFQAKLYTGNGSTQSITFDGEEDMQPDFVWIKNRNSNEWNQIHDSVRGVAKYFFPNANGGDNERSPNDQVTSFDSNGFSLGAGANDSVNTNSNTYVSWNWAISTSFSNDASSTSVGSIDSSGKINTTAGQSIISWTGSGSGATIAHGLGAQPQVVFVKNRDDSASWNVYTVVGGGGKGLFLNENNGFDTDSSYFNGGTASTTTFPVGTANTANGSSDNMIAYCFAEVKGYSRISSFVGNADTDGPWVFCGFRPSFVLIKNTGASEHWRAYDNKRDPYNHMYHVIYVNDGGAESTVNNASEEIDFLSTGFKIRSSAAQLNGSGKTIFFMAFAEAPFVNSKNVPNNAR